MTENPSRLAEVAEKALGAGDATGEPTGSPKPETEAPKSGRGGPRPGSGRPKGKTNASSQKLREERPKAEPPTAEEIQAYAFLGSTLWDIAARFFKLESLTAEESTKLGGALAPVINRWAPSLDAWANEFNLAILVIGLVQSHRRAKDPNQLELIPGDPLVAGYPK